MAKETISMVWQDSGLTFQEDWRQKAVSARKDWLCIWRNMFGDTIIEMLVFNDRKNSFLNHLKGVMFSGSFTTLPKIYMICGKKKESVMRGPKGGSDNKVNSRKVTDRQRYKCQQYGHKLDLIIPAWRSIR